MAKYNFTATHGATFSEHVINDEGEAPAAANLVTWAAFKRTLEDEVDKSGNAHPLYFFGTDDADIAKRVTAVKEYGITKVDKPLELRHTDAAAESE